jgi:predicted enzyme related to lactoylglutathione lyase
VRIDAIVFDCRDAAPLARFWAEALGWSVGAYDEVDSELPVLFFTEVPEDKVTKNRVHLDVLADEDLEAEVERLEDLGATIHNWAEGDGGVWCVMLDPQGNEFCVMPPDDEVA